MALTANSFKKCAPSISTNIKACGSVALCNAQPLTTQDLEDGYMKSGEYRVMDALLQHEMEIKMCEATQNGLFDFLMANKVNMSKKVIPEGKEDGLLQIAPFIKAKQLSPINNEFWLFEGGEASGENWVIQATSAGNVPADVRSFPEGMQVYANGKSAGGSATRTAWKVVSVTDNGDDTLEVVLSSLNDNSNLDADKLESPEEGYLTRGSKNVSDFEKDCAEQPAYMNNKLVPFWVGTKRWSMCSSSKYDQYRKLVYDNNPLFREFGDLKEIDKNRQLATDFQKRWTNDFFNAKAYPNQTLADYDQLDEITSFDASDLGLGVDGGICVGKRAEPVGVYEQLAECGRVVDLLGQQLNLPALFQAFYNIIRVRSTNGNTNRIIDVFTDTRTAEKINSAMIAYYNDKSQNTMRLTMDIEGFRLAKKADFGFLYRSYPLFYPQGVTMNVLTHWSFDDELDAASASNIGDTARKLWVLDFSGIYPGIIATNRIVAETGDLKKLAELNPDFACVMKVHTRKQTLNSVTYTVVVECPFGNLILENFDSQIASIEEVVDLSYDSPDQTTTTTAP